jgi:hypothetical protein
MRNANSTSDPFSTSNEPGSYQSLLLDNIALVDDPAIERSSPSNDPGYAACAALGWVQTIVENWPSTESPDLGDSPITMFSSAVNKVALDLVIAMYGPDEPVSETACNILLTHAEEGLTAEAYKFQNNASEMLNGVERGVTNWMLYNYGFPAPY